MSSQTFADQLRRVAATTRDQDASAALVLAAKVLDRLTSQVGDLLITVRGDFDGAEDEEYREDLLRIFQIQTERVLDPLLGITNRCWICRRTFAEHAMVDCPGYDGEAHRACKACHENGRPPEDPDRPTLARPRGDLCSSCVAAIDRESAAVERASVLADRLH